MFDPDRDLSLTEREVLVHILGLEKVLKELLGDFGCTSWLLAKIMNLDRSVIRKHLLKLSRKGFLRREVVLYSNTFFKYRYRSLVFDFIH